MSDGWDIVAEYADTVSAMVETENDLRAENDRLRKALEASAGLLSTLTSESDSIASAVLRMAREALSGLPSAPNSSAQ